MDDILPENGHNIVTAAESNTNIPAMIAKVLLEKTPGKFLGM